ncbi:MAG: hypothetical protein HGA28_08515 [Anaerolineaceae bacterium]|nr:hypothetical protein [Anaerolineaceae bacterium]
MKKNQKAGRSAGEITELKTRFLLEAMGEAQQTNRFLDAKAGVLVSFESALLFLVVAIIFDSRRFAEIKGTILSMPAWNSALILVYCAVYLSILIAHIIYTLRALSPARDPEQHVSMGGYKSKRLFFLKRDDSSGKIQPSVAEYAGRLSSLKDREVIHELVFELMKLSYIRDVKSERVQRSLEALKYLIVGTVVFGVMLALSY